MNFSKIVRVFYLITAITFASCASNDAPSTGASSEPAVSESRDSAKKSILFFGNSITAGYGLESHETFVSILQRRIDSLGYNYELINAGVSGETTATGSNRVNWVMEQQQVDIFVLELGANDGLRGVPVSETYKNLVAIIDKVRAVNPHVKIILAGMMIPPSMGPEYSSAFQKLYPAVAEEKKVKLIPFILNDVAGIDSLNLPDGIHPNAAGEKIVAENVWEVLKTVVE